MESVQHVLTPEGWALLNALPPYDPVTVDALQRELRRTHPPELVAAALTQSRLRQAAHAKFGDFAARMVFTDTGLQQATRLAVAARHAARYRDAGLTRVIDLTAGLGADALAMAGLGLTVTAVEADETTAACATVNLMPFPNARVIHGDALAQDLSGFDAAFADPARRTARGRTFDPAAYSPPLDAVLDLRHRLPLGVKVAPGIPHQAIPAEAHAEWVSVDGAVVEAGLWFGALAESPGRAALVLARGQAHRLVASSSGNDAAPQAEVAPLGRYLYEPDGAVIRAGGVAALAERLAVGTVAPGIAYLTGDRLEVTAFAQAFEVLESVPVKQLGPYLREKSIGHLEIKKRGMDVVPDQLRTRLKLRGDGSATVILTRVGARHTALLVRRMAV